MEKYNEAIEASKIVYEIEGSLLKKKKIEDYLDLPQLPNKTLINARHTPNGMTAVAYQDNTSGEIIIAYCGTNLSGDFIADVATDASIVRDSMQIQVPTALAFYNDVKSAHPENAIVLTGHSLGGGLANEVNVLTGGGNRSITFNPAPLGNVTRMMAAKMDVSNFTNYNTNQDPVTLAGSTLGFIGVPYPNGLVTVGGGGHNLDEFSQIDVQAYFEKERYIDDADALVMKIGQSSKEAIRVDTVDVDWNEDGVIDKTASVKGMTTYRNLLNGSELRGKSGQSGTNEIMITPSVLFHFASTLKTIATVEIPQLLANLQVISEMNERVGSQYINRILMGTENIDYLLQSEGMTKMVQLAVKGYELLIDNQNSIQAACNFSSKSWMKKFQSSEYEGGADFVKGIKSLEFEMAELDRDLSVFKYGKRIPGSGYSYGYTTLSVSRTPIALLADLKNVLNTMSEVVAQTFKGEGNRAGFKDGLQEALKETLAIQTKNLQTVGQAVLNAAQITELIATHFENRDQAISAAIQQGTIQPNMNQITLIPITYAGYLQENNILDDVADVIDAWNKQINKATSNIENNIFSMITNVMEKHKSRHDAVYDSVVRGNFAIESLMRQMETKIKIKEKQMRKEPSALNYIRTVEVGVIYKDVGMIRDMIGDSYNTISTLRSILREAKVDLHALSGSINTFKSALSGDNSNLDKAIREQIYKNANLDEIVQIERMNQRATQTMIHEFTHAINSIEATQKGSAINMLVDELKSVQKLLEYFTRLSQECFGG